PEPPPRPAPVVEPEPASQPEPAPGPAAAAGTAKGSSGGRWRLWAGLAAVIVVGGGIGAVVALSGGDDRPDDTAAPTTTAAPGTTVASATTAGAPATTAAPVDATFSGAWEMTEETTGTFNLIVVDDLGGLMRVDVYADEFEWCTPPAPFYELMWGVVEGDRLMAEAVYYRCPGQPTRATDFSYEWVLQGGTLVDPAGRVWTRSDADPRDVYPGALGDPLAPGSAPMLLTSADLYGYLIGLLPESGGYQCETVGEIEVDGVTEEQFECRGSRTVAGNDFVVAHGFVVDAGVTVEELISNGTVFLLLVDGEYLPPAGYMVETSGDSSRISFVYMGALSGYHELLGEWRYGGEYYGATLAEVTFP
ncbi:MAG: hypothetical protein KQH83_09070, partial [Actinobacteria bacterium]|nr:hypothetical protein [Actinomycetota bacterium]